jgi:hypothetical protein
MIKLFEDGSALSQVQDILKNNGATALPPENLSPDVDHSKEDEEVAEQLEESLDNDTMSRLVNLLHEETMSDAARIRAFIKSPTINKSYSAFAAGKFGNSSINESKYKAYVKTMVGRGDFTLTPEEEAQIFTKSGNPHSSSGNKKGKELFDRPELGDDYVKSDTLSKFETEYADTDLTSNSQSSSADDMFNNMTDIVKDIGTGAATNRHALIYGDPGIGKTYECTRVLSTAIQSNHRGAKMLYYKGNVGKSMTAVVSFFFHNRHNKVIMLDDNDAMLMVNGVSQEISLFFKAVLDPDAINQPILVPVTVLDRVSKGLEALRATEESGGAKAEIAKRQKLANRVPPSSLRTNKLYEGGVLLSFDKERLKEGQLLMYSNGKEILDTRIPLDEALELYESFYETKKTPLKEKEYNYDDEELTYEKLYERYDEDDDDDIDIDEKDNDIDEEFLETDDLDEDGRMPTEFIFDSSVIFISNLREKDIDRAVWDRFTTVKISLNPTEFMNRLGSPAVFANCANVNPLISSTPQKLVDWAKKSVFGVLLGVVEAWKAGVTLMNVKIEIPTRTLTFRMFSSFVEFFLRSARGYASRTLNEELSASSPQQLLDKIALGIEKKLLAEMIRKICLGGD